MTMGIYECLWMFMDIYGFLGVYGYLWVLMGGKSVYGYGYIFKH